MRSLTSHSDQDKQMRACAAIDRIADGFKELHAIWLEVQRDQGERDGAVEVSREIAPAQAADGLITLQETAKFLHVTEQTVHAWRKRGIIEGLQFGEEWRFVRDELIKAGRKTQAPKKPLRMVS